MSKDIEVRLNRAGVRELLQSSGVMAALVSEAQTRAAQAGDGYEVSTYVGKTRANASYISAESEDARKDNLKNNTLLRTIS